MDGIWTGYGLCMDWIWTGYRANKKLVMFFLSNRHTDESIFHDSLKISHQNSPKLVWRSHKCQRFSKNMSEDYWRLPKTFEDERIVFWSYASELKYNLRDKIDISKAIDIFTNEDKSYWRYVTTVLDVISYEFQECCIFQ